MWVSGFLVWVSVSFLDLVVCLFAQARLVFSYYFLRQVFCPLLFWEPYNVNVILLDVIFIGFLSSLHFLKSFFCFVWVSSLALSSRSLILYSVSASVLLKPSVQLLYSSTLWLLFGTFFYFLSLCWSSPCVYPFSPEFSKHLYDHFFELLIK